MSSKSRKQSLLEAVKQQMPTTNKPWKQRLTEEQYAELEELRAAYRRGELRHLTYAAMLRTIQQQFGMRINRTTFAEWLNEPEEKA